MPRSEILLTLSFLIVGGLAAPGTAHDFWLQPSTFAPQADAVLSVELLVGYPAESESVARMPARIERFELVGDFGKKDVVGEAGESPAGYVRLPDAGPLVLVYDSDRKFIELEAAKFTAYLEEEGLDHVLRERGETEAPGRETYSRCAKALIVVGGGAPVDRRVGLPLELLLDGVSGSEFSLRLVLGDAPAPDVLVKLKDLDRTASDPLDVATGRTDAEGRVTLAAPGPGRWLITAVHMARAPEGLLVEDQPVDWESHWASLAFDLPEGAPK